MTPIETSVLFPIVGCQNPVLVRVTAANFWKRGNRAQVHVGPKAQTRAEAIERIIRCARFYGPAKGTDGTGFEVSLELTYDPIREGFDGESYGLAVALADMRATGLLPWLGSATVIATGRVEDDDRIRAISLLDRKLELIESVLASGKLQPPVHIFAPAENLQHEGAALAPLRERLRNHGATLYSVGLLSELSSPALLPFGSAVSLGSILDKSRGHASEGPNGRPPPPTTRLAWGRAAGLVLVLGAAGGGLLAFDTVVRERACADVASDPDVARECWDLRPLTFSMECRFPEGEGFTVWMDCPGDGTLNDRDKFRFKVVPGADGYLYAWEVDERRQGFVDLIFDVSNRRVSAGEPMLLPRAGVSLELDRQTERTSFVAILSGAPIDLFERSRDSELYASPIAPLVRALGEGLVLKRRGQL